jgi:hypothetical protein
MFLNHKETLLAKTQEQLLKYQEILAFVQGTEDDNSIARNKNYLVAYIMNNVIDKLTLKERVVRIPFHMKDLKDGVRKINHCFVPGPHYTCPATSIYGKHIKSLIVVNLEFQPHEARNFSLTKENPGWYKDLVENHQLFKKVHVMQCERHEIITFEVRHMVPLIVERNIAGTDEEASLFALFKAATLLGTQHDDEVNFNYIQVAIIAGWKHLNERICSDSNKDIKHLASRMKHVATFGLPWETRLHLHGKSVFEVCLSLILAIFFTNIKCGFMKALPLVEPPERVDGKNPEAYQVSNRHFDALLELTNGDMEDGYITSKESGALQVAGYCNIVTHYIGERAGKSSAYKEGAAEEEEYMYLFHFPEVDKMKDIGGPRSKRIIDVPDLDEATSGQGCEEAEMEEF